MTAEIGEHERAPRACESYPTSLRATLRAPPSKWAIKAFFRRVSAASRGRGQPRRGYRRPKPTARSDVGRLRSRRAACFLWYFLSLRKKVRPPSGRKPHCSRRSRRVNPLESVSFRQSWRTLMLTVGFPLAPCSPLDRLPVQINNPMELQVPPRAVVGASAPPAGECFRQSRRTPTQTGAFPRGKQPARLALSCAPFAAYLNSELFPLVTFRTHRRRVSAAANENDQHVQNTRWSFL